MVGRAAGDNPGRKQITCMPEDNANTDDRIKALIEEFRQGRADAFDELVEQISPRIYGTLLSRLKERAEDVFQEFLMRLLRLCRSQTVFDERPVIWLLVTIARNLAYDELRKLKAESGTVQLDPENPRHHSVASATTIEKQMLLDEAFQVALIDEERDVLDLQFNWGLKQAEIAEMLGLPVSTVKLRRLTAREKLEYYLKRKQDQAGEGKSAGR